MMSRKKPLKHLWDYGESKQQETFFTKRPSILNLAIEEEIPFDAKEEYLVQQKKLQKLREEQKVQNKICEERVELVRKMHDELHDAFLPINNFLRETDDKVNAVKVKVNKEIEMHNQLKHEIGEKRKKNNELLEFRKKLRGTAEEYKIYEKVVQEVVEKGKTYESVEDLISRCDAIMLAQDEITGMNRRLLEELGNMKNRLVADVKKAGLLVLGLINKVATAAHDYERAELEASLWERRYKEARLVGISAFRDKNSIRNVILNLYQLLRRRRQPMLECGRFEVESELDFIRNEVELLRDMIEEYHRRKSKKCRKIK